MPRHHCKTCGNPLHADDNHAECVMLGEIQASECFSLASLCSRIAFFSESISAPRSLLFSSSQGPVRKKQQGRGASGCRSYSSWPIPLRQDLLSQANGTIWINDELCIYIALFVYCCTPKVLYNHVGGGSLLNHHQCAASTWMMRRLPQDNGASALTTHQLQVERRERHRANQVDKDY